MGRRNNMKKVVFWNAFHNGDIHVSRGIIRQIIKKVHSIDPNIEFLYSHKNDPTLLCDIPNLGFDVGTIQKTNPHESLIIDNDTVYINTWYDQQYQKYARQYGILTIDALYAALDDVCKKLWNFSLQDISDNVEDFFPIIDYSKFEIENINRWLQQHPEKKILIENGAALSGQAHNLNMTPLIITLANEHPDKAFILSSKEHFQSFLIPPNIYWTSNIINKNGTDLNEISFLSTHCDLIIGKASGVFTFALTHDNLFKRNIKLLCFSHLLSSQNKFWLGKLFAAKTSYSATVIINGTSNINDIYNMIKGQL